MGQLRNANSNDKKQFPGADFAAADIVPITQCEDSPVFGSGDSTTGGPFRLNSVGAFTGFNYNDDNVHITSNPGGNTGLFEITTNSNDQLSLATDPGNGANTTWHLEPADPPTKAGNNATTISASMQLVDTGAFAGSGLSTRICVITNSPTGNTGRFPIVGNTNNQLFFNEDPGSSTGVSYFLESANPLSNVQTIQEIHEAAQAAGAATMIKGGQLFIDGILADLSQACKITLAPV